MIGIIDYKGKQLKVSEGKEYKVPLFECGVGDKVKFDKVLLVSGDKIEVGAPYLDGASVEGEVLEVGQSPKTTVVKFRAKKRYKKIGNHRQDYVSVKINKIMLK